MAELPSALLIHSSAWHKAPYRPLRILYFYQYFSTPQGSWGTRVFEFAKRWAKEGDQIIVVTSIYDKSDLTSSGISELKNYDGVQVRVLNIRISNKHKIIYRLWTFFLYSVLSSWYAITTRADVVIASSGPITVGIPGLAARYLRGRKLILEVRDMWPEGAIQMGLINSRWAKKLAYWFEGVCYRAARHIVALSPGMRDEIIEKIGDPSKVSSVPNASDNDLFARDTSSFILPDWALGKRIFLYTGNIGQVNNSMLLVRAAEAMQSAAPSALFLMIGDGQQRETIQQYISQHGITNLRIMGLMPKADLVAWVQRAYFMLVPLEGRPILDTSSPNKLFDAMAAGIPVIQTTQGWIKTLLRENDCGITIPFDRPDLLAEECIAAIADPSRRDTMGLNAKQVAMQQFDRTALASKMHSIIQQVVAGE